MRTTLVAMVVGLAVAGSVGAGYGVPTAGGAPAGPSSASAPVSTTWLHEPDDLRTEAIELDSSALLAQMVAFPAPFPGDSPPGTCVDLLPGTATFPLFDGGSVSIAGVSARMCRDSSWWTVSWRGENRRGDGGLDSEGAAVSLLQPDGSERGGLLMNLTVGPTSYRYLPTGDESSPDAYELTGYDFPPPLEVVPRAGAATSVPARDTSGAAPAVAIPGTADFTG